jgi:hypothetical protein
MKMRRYFIRLIVFSLIITASFISCGLSDSPPGQSGFTVTERIYWIVVDDGIYRIKSADMDDPGAATQVILETDEYAMGDIEIDSINKKMYWIDTSNCRILRADLDGGGIEEIINSDDAIIDICIDTKRGKLYWTVQGLDMKIRRANLDGLNQEDFLVREKAVYYLAMDVDYEKLYWAELTAICSAYLDGTGSPEEVLDDKFVDFCMASDVVDNKIYYSLNVGNNELERADVITKETETLYAANPFLNAMAIDIVNLKLYFCDTGIWDENSGSYITQSHLDGTGVVHLIGNEVNETFIEGIAFEYE